MRTSVYRTALYCSQYNGICWKIVFLLSGIAGRKCILHYSILTHLRNVFFSYLCNSCMSLFPKTIGLDPQCLATEKMSRRWVLLGLVRVLPTKNERVRMAFISRTVLGIEDNQFRSKCLLLKVTYEETWSSAVAEKKTLQHRRWWVKVALSHVWNSLTDGWV